MSFKPSIFLTHEGATRSLPEWSRHLSIPYSTLLYRIDKGLPVEKVLAPKVVREGMRFAHDGKNLTLHEWAKLLGTTYKILYERIVFHGIPPERALTSRHLRRAKGWDHGSLTGYKYGCRCDACKAKKAEYSRMSRKPENVFITSVHTHLPSIKEFYRMKNNNEYNGGIADVWYSGKADLWIEYKFLELPKRDTTTIDLTTGNNPMLSALQQEWLRSRHAEGRSVGVIVGCKEGGVWYPGTSWDKPLSTAIFKSRLQLRKELANMIFSLCHPI